MQNWRRKEQLKNNLSSYSFVPFSPQKSTTNGQEEEAKREKVGLNLSLIVLPLVLLEAGHWATETERAASKTNFRGGFHNEFRARRDFQIP